jgi:SAM-dependent methyltransferase
MIHSNPSGGHHLPKAATHGEASYVWRAGQERRWKMIRDAAGDRLSGKVLDNGCGIGLYLQRMCAVAFVACGLEYDIPRAKQARTLCPQVISAAGEQLPYSSNTFDLVLSHEVLEHVKDDRIAMQEICRVLKAPTAGQEGSGGRLILFTPNRWYPFETHGVYWRGKYRFGNIPLVNYLPRRLRDRIAPHVRTYTTCDLEKLLEGLPVTTIQRTVIFGGYDNIIARWGRIGAILRKVLQGLESTGLRAFGLSHFWVVEKTST